MQTLADPQSKIDQKEFAEFLEFKKFKDQGGSIADLTGSNLQTLPLFDTLSNDVKNQGEGGFCMKGVIRSLQTKCPKCRGKFTDTGRALVCPTCLVIPDKYFVDLHYEGQRIKLYRDKDGYILDSYRRASRLLEHIRYEIQNHSFEPKFYIKSDFEKFQFDKYVWDWFDRSSVNLAPSTKRKRKGFIKNYHIPFFDKKDIRKIRGGMIEDYFLDLPKKMSNKQKKNIIDDLHKMFTDALRREDIERIPAFVEIEFETPMFNWIDRETQEKVLEQIPSYDRDIFKFIILTGARPGEIRGLKWDCIDLKQGVIYLKRTFSDANLEERTKTKKWRPLPITEELLEILKRQDRSINGFVFVNKHGRHYSDKISQTWKKACKKVDIDINLYNGSRHSFGSQRVNEGFTLEEIGGVMGHSDVRMTKKYARILTENLKAVIEGKKKIVRLKSSVDRPEGLESASK